MPNFVISTKCAQLFHHSCTDFETCGFHRNTKILMSQSQEQNFFFSSNKKKLFITHQGLLFGKKWFCSGGNL